MGFVLRNGMAVCLVFSLCLLTCLCILSFIEIDANESREIVVISPSEEVLGEEEVYVPPLPDVFVPKHHNLVFAMISENGNKSLSTWIDQPKWNYTFDLVLYYYDPGFPSPPNCQSFAHLCVDRAGFKWPSLYHFLTTYMYTLNVTDDLTLYQPYLYHEFKSPYKAIFAVDDDISISGRDINKLFSDFVKYKLNFAQPSYNGGKSDLHFPRIQRWRGNTILRYSNFVENAALLINTEILYKILPIMRKSISGWGIDYCFFHTSESDVHEIGTIHTVKVVHPPNLNPTKASQNYIPGENTTLKMNKYGGLLAPRDTINRREGEALMTYCGAFMYVPKVFFRIQPGQDRKTVIRSELKNYEYYRSFNAIRSVW